MRAIFVSILLFIVSGSQAQITKLIEYYQSQQIPFGTLGNRFDDICMVNDTIGYAVTSNGMILKTFDAFKTITILAYNLPYARSVAFINDTVGFVGLLSGQLLYTSNGGLIWQFETNHLFSNDTILPRAPQRGVCGLTETPNSFYACGAYFGGPFVAKYNGAGQDWSYYDMRSLASGLIDIYFINDSVGYVTGISRNPLRGGGIWKTTNSGETWTNVLETGVAHDKIWKIYALTDSILYAAVEEQAPNSMRYLKSIDGGNTWTSYQISEQSLSLQSVGFLDEYNGFAGGHFNGYFSTVDGGINWTYNEGADNLNRFIPFGKGQMLVSGKGIFNVKPFLIPNDENVIDDKIAKANIIKLYPNPTQGKFSVELDIAENTGGYLILYDVSGAVFQEVPYQYWEKGIHHLSFDAGAYPVGVYYLGFINDFGSWFTSVVVVD